MLMSVPSTYLDAKTEYGNGRSHVCPLLWRHSHTHLSPIWMCHLHFSATAWERSSVSNWRDTCVEFIIQVRYSSSFRHTVLHNCQSATLPCISYPKLRLSMRSPAWEEHHRQFCNTLN